MEEKHNLTNNDYHNNQSNAKKIIYFGNSFKKPEIRKYNTKINPLNKNKKEVKNKTSINDSKKKQKQIKQCFLDSTKCKEKNIQKKQIKYAYKKEGEENQNINKIINKSGLKEKKPNSKNKNIKVNTIRIEKINLENTFNMNFSTNRDFYHKSSGNRNDFDLMVEEPNIINKYISDFYNSKKSNMLSVKTFNSTNLDKELLNKEIQNSDFINTINPSNINQTLCDIPKNKNKNKVNENTYDNNISTGKSKESDKSSKNIINFKNIKTFYAHLEIFISLYLKRIFKYFIEKIKIYKKSKNIMQNIEINQKEDSKHINYRPIVNVNNAHCSLYCSINLNQDKLLNTLFDNRNIYISNNAFTPLTKSNDIGKIKHFEKEEINNKKNRILLINPEYDINLGTNQRIDNTNSNSIYIPKKKISKSNTDLLKDIKANINNKNVKSSPIKEMNINLKQINVCRLNDLNQLYLNRTLYKNNTHNYNYSEMNPIIKLNNNNISNHVKYNSNNIFPINNNSNNNTNEEKNKLKKIQSAKNGIYMKPKEKVNKKKIKEIKIKNKLTPIKKDIISSRKENYVKSESILTTYNSFNKTKYLNDNSRIYENLHTINSNKGGNPIKKIYIKRGSKQKNPNIMNLKENLFDSYKKQFYSTFLNFNTNKIKIDDEILIKQIVTSDKRLFINIKYINYGGNNNIKKKKNNIIKVLNLKNSNECSLSIISNKIELKKEIDNNMILNKYNHNLKMQDIYSFDNDKTGKIRAKNISFSFKEYPPSKEESIEFSNESGIKFINILKTFIAKNVGKYLFTKFKKIKYLMVLLNNKKQNFIKLYFSKWKKKLNNRQIKVDKSNCKVYHKINYNDDFNLNKRLKTPKNIQKYENLYANCKTKAYNLTIYNSINQFKSKNRLNSKNNIKDFSSNKKYKEINKLMNKEMNICVHNNTKKNNEGNSNNIALNKLKNNFFLMRIKLIKNALKMIKNAL